MDAVSLDIIEKRRYEIDEKSTETIVYFFEDKYDDERWPRRCLPCMHAWSSSNATAFHFIFTSQLEKSSRSNENRVRGLFAVTRIGKQVITVKDIIRMVIAIGHATKKNWTSRYIAFDCCFRLFNKTVVVFYFRILYLSSGNLWAREVSKTSFSEPRIYPISDNKNKN